MNITSSAATTQVEFLSGCSTHVEFDKQGKLSDIKTHFFDKCLVNGVERSVCYSLDPIEPTFASQYGLGPENRGANATSTAEITNRRGRRFAVGNWVRNVLESNKTPQVAPNRSVHLLKEHCDAGRMDSDPVRPKLSIASRFKSCFCRMFGIHKADIHTHARGMPDGLEEGKDDDSIKMLVKYDKHYDSTVEDYVFTRPSSGVSFCSVLEDDTDSFDDDASNGLGKWDGKSLILNGQYWRAPELSPDDDYATVGSPPTAAHSAELIYATIDFAKKNGLNGPHVTANPDNASQASVPGRSLTPPPVPLRSSSLSAASTRTARIPEMSATDLSMVDGGRVTSEKQLSVKEIRTTFEARMKEPASSPTAPVSQRKTDELKPMSRRLDGGDKPRDRTQMGNQDSAFLLHNELLQRIEGRSGTRKHAQST